MKRIRYAIIGAGTMGLEHIQNISLIKNAEVIAISDIHKKSITNIKKKIIGEKGKFLKENLEVTINFYNENPLSVNLPNQIQCGIDTTDVALKGQTVSSSYKPATLENGIKIMVPPFINSGDKIILDTRTLEYIKKIK